jgi:hypothetical protein
MYILVLTLYFFKCSDYGLETQKSKTNWSWFDVNVLIFSMLVKSLIWVRNHCLIAEKSYEFAFDILFCVVHKSKELLVLNNHTYRGHIESPSFMKPKFSFLFLNSLKINMSMTTRRKILVSWTKAIRYGLYKYDCWAQAVPLTCVAHKIICRKQIHMIFQQSNNDF